MSFEPNATQAQTLLRLLFIAEEPAMSKLQPNLPSDKRKGLLDAGLIALEKRGRAQHVSLTDRGWAWASENFDKLCPAGLNRLRPEILAAILAAIVRNMSVRGLSLAEMVRPEMLVDASDSHGFAAASEETMPGEALSDTIRKACLQLTEGRSGAGIRLTDLRRALVHVDCSLLDAALLQMQSADDIVLSTLERFELRAEDESAAVRVAGLPRHVVYLKRF